MKKKYPMKTKILLLISTILSLQFVYCEDVGSLHGIIKDTVNHEPIPGAQVYSPDLEIGTIADSEGKYLILNFPVGVYDITISMIGYSRKIIKGVSITPGDTTRLDVSLTGFAIEYDLVRPDVSFDNFEELPIRDDSGLIKMSSGAVKRSTNTARTGHDKIEFYPDGEYTSRKMAVGEDDLTSGPRYHFIPDTESRRKTSNPKNNYEKLPPLTAATHNDNEEYPFFLKYLQKYPNMQGVYRRDMSKRSIIRIVNHKGEPVHNARFRIESNLRTVMWEGSTYANGESVFYPHVMHEDFYQDNLFLTVLDPQGLPYHRIHLSDDFNRMNTFQYDHWPNQPKYVDILFILDTTGSMADEIQQLKDTIFAIHSQIHNRFPGFEVRFGLVQYRDVDDRYRVKWDLFSHNIDQFQNILHNVEANGGGDKPEDVQAALDSALHKMDWNPDAIKLAFLVGDARPHLDYEQFFDYIDAAREANQRGIKIHTVGASGLLENGEYIFRQIAALTYGEYVFLTYGETGESDGSGIGKVSHHTGFNFAPSNLDQAIVELISRDLSYHSQSQWVEDNPPTKINKQDEYYQRRMDNLWLQIKNQLSSSDDIIGIMPPFKIDTEQERELAEYLRNLSTSTILNSTGIALVDRDHLDQLVAEKALNETGLTQQDDFGSIADLLKGNLLLFGELTKSGQEAMVLAKAIEPDTGRIMAAARIRI